MAGAYSRARDYRPPMALTGMNWQMARHDHGGSGHHHEHRDQHGNPEDLEAYLARLEDPSRAQWQKPDEVIAALSLKETDVVAEIGAGPGVFTLHLAPKVRQVYAVEVEPRIITVLRDRIDRAKATNVTPVLGLPGDPLIGEGTCDWVVVVNAFHHFPEPVAYLKRLSAALKPGGRIANIDFHQRELPVGPPSGHKVAREDFLAMAQNAGLEVIAEPAFLPYQYFFVLRPRA